LISAETVFALRALREGDVHFKLKEANNMSVTKFKMETVSKS